MTRIPGLLLVIASLALVLAFAACTDGGGDKDGDDPTEVATEAGGGEGDEDTPEADGDKTPSAAELPFDSFHYTVELSFRIDQPAEGESTFISGLIEGDYAGPDSHAFESTFEFAGISGTEEVVIIGDDAWYREGAGQWRETTASDPDVQNAVELTSADPDFLQDPELAEGLEGIDSEEEEINSVTTRRYHISRDAVAALADLLGEEFVADAAGLEDFEMTVWLDEETDGLVRAEISATAGPEIFSDDTGLDVEPGSTVIVEMLIDVTRINDEDIEIEPPA
jgi:hypothetical protein